MTVGADDAGHPFRLSHPQAALEAATQRLRVTIGIEREPPAELGADMEWRRREASRFLSEAKMGANR